MNINEFKANNFKNQNLKNELLYKSLKNTTGGICISDPIKTKMKNNIDIIFTDNYNKNSLYYIHNIIDVIYNKVLDETNNNEVLLHILNKIIEKFKINYNYLKYQSTIFYIINKVALLDKTHSNYDNLKENIYRELDKIDDLGNPPGSVIEDNIKDYALLLGLER
jgi:hypothetical protein